MWCVMFHPSLNGSGVSDLLLLHLPPARWPHSVSPSSSSPVPPPPPFGCQGSPPAASPRGPHRLPWRGRRQAGSDRAGPPRRPRRSAAARPLGGGAAAGRGGREAVPGCPAPAPRRSSSSSSSCGSRCRFVQGGCEQR